MKPKSYPRQRLALSQQRILDLIAPGSRVLEMGCAMGFMTRYLAEDLGCKVTGVEVNAEEAAKAEPFADRLIVGNLALPETWDGIGGPFDYVVFADVLEHLADPWEALRRTAALLDTGGRVLASIPNVAHYRIRIGLLFGRFDYVDYGILDDTHLRFFTKKSTRELFETSGYTVQKLIPICWSAHKRWIASCLPNVFANQFVVEAAPKHD